MTATLGMLRPYRLDDGWYYDCLTCETTEGPHPLGVVALTDARKHHAHEPTEPDPARATVADQLHDGLLIMGAGIPSGLGITHGVYWASGEFLPWWMQCGIGVLCGVVAMLGLRTWRSRAAGRETQA